MIRIITGSSKGTKLEVPKLITRPLTDRIRTSLFDLIGQEVTDATILDLFAGSGVFGIEALSRGANFATFVDSGFTSSKIIARNLFKTNLSGKAEIINTYTDKYLKTASKKFSLIFLDPPFKMDENEIFYTVKQAINLLTEEGLLILRVVSGTRLPEKLSLKGKTISKVYVQKYGKSTVGFYRLLV